MDVMATKKPSKIEIFGAQKLFDFLVFRRHRNFGFFGFAKNRLADLLYLRINMECAPKIAQIENEYKQAMI